MITDEMRSLEKGCGDFEYMAKIYLLRSEKSSFFLIKKERD